jgi:hypothetical protein
VEHDRVCYELARKKDDCEHFKKQFDRLTSENLHETVNLLR